MRTLYQGNLNYKFAWRPTKRECLVNLFNITVEGIAGIIISVPLCIYIWTWIIQ